MAEKILLTKIRLDGGTQPREELDEALVQHYTEELLEGQEFPPVDLYFDGKHYWLSDGFHRFHAHERAAHKDISAIVNKGTKRDAFVASLKANAYHGKPRTPEERRYVVTLALEDIELGELSDVQIANACRVSGMTVGRVRKALGLQRETITGKGGKRINISKWGRKPALKPVAPPAFENEDKLKEMATEITAVSEENTKLKDMLAVRSLPVSEDAQAEVAETIDSLREQVRELEGKVKSLTQSRDEFMAKNAEMIKQINYWKRRAEKAA
jgi:hypothetical protein